MPLSFQFEEVYERYFWGNVFKLMRMMQKKIKVPHLMSKSIFYSNGSLYLTNGRIAIRISLTQLEKECCSGVNDGDAFTLLKPNERGVATFIQNTETFNSHTIISAIDRFLSAELDAFYIQLSKDEGDDASLVGALIADNLNTLTDGENNLSIDFDYVLALNQLSFPATSLGAAKGDTFIVIRSGVHEAVLAPLRSKVG
jgi:hypothetical protein